MQMVDAFKQPRQLPHRSKMATVRYLSVLLFIACQVRAFLLDFAQQSDLISDIAQAGRGSASLIRRWQSFCASISAKKKRVQLVLSDLRRLGYSDELPDRPMTSGDAALRAYCSSVSGERPYAMLG